MSTGGFLRAESDGFIGRRSRIERFLVCSTQGCFPVLARTGAETSGDWGNWGGISCQAIRYREETVR